MSVAIARNTDGKTPFVCSCGIKCNLEQHEILDWLTRHSAIYIGAEHKLQQILVTNPDEINSKLANMLDVITKRLQLQDNSQQQGPGKK